MANVRVARGIFQTPTGYRVQASFRGQKKEHRFAATASLRDMRAWQGDATTDLRKGRVVLPGASGTLAAAVRTYLPSIKHLASFKSKRAELHAWTIALGPVARHTVGREDVRRVVARWAQAGVAPKTIQNRLITLAAFYHALDGRRAPAPTDDVAAPRAPASVATPVPARIIRRVALVLLHHERKGWLRSAKTRARFMVLASTGKRPSELKRARREDVDVARGLWRVRTGKGGWGPPLRLNEDARAAWRVFLEADAWGHFDTRSWGRRIYKARWPRRYRLYNLRHSVGIAYSEAGIDLADVQLLMGHRDIRTTRLFYVPALDSRLGAAVRAIDGRLGWGLPQSPPQLAGEGRRKQAETGGIAADRRTTKRAAPRRKRP